MKMSKYPCGFCSTGSHQHCPGVTGEDEHRYQCPCGCPKSVTPYCKVCGATDEIRPDLWVCENATECIQRVDRKRQEIRDNLFPHGRPEPTPTGKHCNCGCGEETRGGKFRPGHDSRFVTSLINGVKAGKITRDQAIDKLNEVSPGLVKKLDAKL